MWQGTRTLNLVDVFHHLALPFCIPLACPVVCGGLTLGGPWWGGVPWGWCGDVKRGGLLGCFVQLLGPPRGLGVPPFSLRPGDPPAPRWGCNAGVGGRGATLPLPSVPYPWGRWFTQDVLVDVFPGF